MKLFKQSGQVNVVTLLLILLLFGFFGSVPFWGYSHSWGYFPSGFLGVLLVIVVLKLLQII